MRDLPLIRSISAIVLAAAIVGCGSGSPGPSAPGGTAAPLATPAATPTRAPSTAEGLCAVFTETLATAALGGPVDAPQSGDVLPRPNGIYCHYQLTGNASTNVEAQFKDMPREEFESLAETLGATTPVAGVGEAAFRRDSSSMGGSGATVVAWNDGRGVTVLLNREGGDQALVNAAAEAIATAVLLTP